MILSTESGKAILKTRGEESSNSVCFRHALHFIFCELIPTVGIVIFSTILLPLKALTIKDMFWHRTF